MKLPLIMGGLLFVALVALDHMTNKLEHTETRLKTEQTKVKQLEANAEQLAKEAAQSRRVAKEYQERKAKVVVEEKIIEKEVIRYVKTAATRDTCTLPSEWVRIHNRAAAGELPGSKDSGPRTPDPAREDGGALRF